MNRKLITSMVVTGLTICFFFLFGRTDSILSNQGSADRSEGSPILISDAGIFKKLERPPVEFYHDKHTLALEKEGCGVCHPQNTDGWFIFKYPKQKDDSTEQGLMNSYHDSCIGCHKSVASEGRKSGHVTCGECHKIKAKSHQDIEHLPIGPDYYNLEDTYHRECVVCHNKDTKLHKEDAKDLNWKDFYIKEKEQKKTALPQVIFDFYLHYQHEIATGGKCETCHHVYSEEEERLTYKKGEESSCRDCHKEKDENKTHSFRKAAHMDCIKCHMELKEKGKATGPFTCGGCHTEKKRQISEKTADIPRPKQGQPDRVLICIEDARMKGVPFNHRGHEANTPACRTCHHQGIMACKECHTQKGSLQGGNVNLAKAYHDITSERSCIGCHNSHKSEPLCSGCHHSMEDGLNKSSCKTCHTGIESEIKSEKKVYSPENLLPHGLIEDMTIDVLQKEYMPGKFPHLAIIERLTEVSNNSKLARHFHLDKMTICSGCHHNSPLELNQMVPACDTCHSAHMGPVELEVPGLLGAYHRQCLGCHKEMGVKPTECTGCHAMKASPKN